MRRVIPLVSALSLLAACSGSSSSGTSTAQSGGSEVSAVVTEAPVTTDTVAEAAPLLASAASRSLLPTVDGARDYLSRAAGWLGATDPNNIGAYVPEWDQGRVDVGNGSEDGVWVHDDIRATALALRWNGRAAVVLSADLYMIFAVDADEVERRARALLAADPEFADADIIINATHNHHGPDSAFSVNDQWYDMAADEMANAIADAWKGAGNPAKVVVASGEHRFGQSDQRDPIINDPRLNVLQVQKADGSGVIATVVQWNDHPESTLGWKPPIDTSGVCAEQGWAPDDCSAEGRYFTADYPGVLRDRLQKAVGGEVLYMNGAVGSQIGPGAADVWKVDEAHPVGDGVTAPAGAEPVEGAVDFRQRNMARTDAIGEQLTQAVLGLLDTTRPVTIDRLDVAQQPFYTRLTNIGFRVLLADGDLGWQTPKAYVCTVRPFNDQSCTDDGGEMVDDPVLTPLIDSQIRKGDVLRTRVTWFRLGDVGFLFMPGELPPELVTGLPSDFATNTEKYFENPSLHATGADYVIPGALLDLSPTDITFTVGLGGDELGYWVPISEYRVKCLDLVMPADSGQTCQQLFDAGLLVSPDAVAGPVCKALYDGGAPSYTPGQEAALRAVCRYGQALGRELGEPEDHYEETNAAGWDLVDDLWAAASELLSG